MVFALVELFLSQLRFTCFCLLSAQASFLPDWLMNWKYTFVSRIAVRILEVIHIYHIVVSTCPSCFEAHAGLSGLLMKGIFDPYLL